MALRNRIPPPCCRYISWPMIHGPPPMNQLIPARQCPAWCIPSTSFSGLAVQVLISTDPETTAKRLFKSQPLGLCDLYRLLSTSKGGFTPSVTLLDGDSAAATSSERLTPSEVSIAAYKLKTHMYLCWPKLPSASQVPWCSGYHVSLSHSRSPVRGRAEPFRTIPWLSFDFFFNTYLFGLASMR